MVDLVILQTISTIAAATGVLVAATGYILNLRSAHRSRQTQMFMQLYDHFHNTEFWRQYGDIIFNTDFTDSEDHWKKYGPNNLEAFANWMSFGTYFTGIGVLLRRDMIDIRLVEDLVGDYVIWVYRKWRTLIMCYDPKSKPQSIMWFEYLYEEVVKQRKREGKKEPVPVSSPTVEI